ncbi:MAG: hypothetical protein KJ971_07910 [Firmicutes bacterium]|nr:hypothetical protein [Bacillota bacterium]
MKSVDVRKHTIRNITLSAMLLAVLIVQEELLIFLPNIQFTVVLLMVYAAILPYSMLISLTVGYVIIDSLIMGSFNMLYVVPMLIGWILLVLVSKKLQHQKIWILIMVSFIFGFVYGWLFIPSKFLEIGIDRLWPYFISDLPFEIMMAISNIVTVILLYVPLKKLLLSLMNQSSSEL